MDKVRIALGCDHIGFELKEQLKEYLVSEKNAEIILDPIKIPEDGNGTYPAQVKAVCEGIQKDEFRHAILICGTGIGFCCMSNRYWGIRAVTADNTYSAERARLSMNAQVLCLGARIMSLEYAKKVVDAWYDKPFSWDRESSVINLKLFEEYENSRMKKPDIVSWSMGFSPDDQGEWPYKPNN